jgi:hypothetical protein
VSGIKYGNISNKFQFTAFRRNGLGEREEIADPGPETSVSAYPLSLMAGRFAKTRRMRSATRAGSIFLKQEKWEQGGMEPR